MKTNTLPTYLPVISVYGAIIFCDAVLPLPVNAEQYNYLYNLSLENDGIVGIIQPITTDARSPLPLHSSGTAAKIVGKTELDDETYIVHLKGLCRFVVEEDYIEDFVADHCHRFVRVSYNKYIFADSIAQDVDKVDKDGFISLAKNYMQQQGVSPDWSELSEISAQDLVNFLAMLGPFSSCEKQAVLETISPTEQCILLQDIMRMSLFSVTSPSTLIH